MSIITMTDSNWADIVANAEKPLIVEFWADWCQPCRAMAIVLDQIDQEYSDRLEIAKANVDTENWLRSDGINSIPHIRIFNQGEYIGDINGAMSKEDLIRELNKFIEL